MNYPHNESPESSVVPGRDKNSMKWITRIGARSMIQGNIDQAVELGASLSEDTNAGTLAVEWQGQTLLKAISKDDHSWIVSYNPDFYPSN